MKNKTTILFDFDGTLFDSKIGILNAVKYAMTLEGITEFDDETLEAFIGPPLHYSFQKHYNICDDKLDETIVTFRKYYAKQGYKETDVYPGVIEMLDALKAQGKTLAIATAKPTKYAKQILEIFEMTHYFDSIQGSLTKGELFPKDRIIGTVIKELDLFDTEDCIMIGDTIYDIKGAQAHNMRTIGVTYGYGKEKDLKDARANKIVHSVEELKALLV
jgi:phosphoglycolate phosphatase